MFKYINFKKTLVLKLFSIFTAVSIICSSIGVNGLKAIAEDLPIYDEALGTYTFDNGVLTAAPYDNAGFRGWYDKSGKEVSIEPEFKIPSGAKSNDYIPVFYNFNLAAEGGFENYADGTDLKGITNNEGWEGLCDNELQGYEDWTEFTISTDRAYEGEKSLKIKSYENTAYRSFANLETNTQYTVSFYYNIEPSASGNNSYLSFVSVIDGNTAVTQRGNTTTKTLASKSFDLESGSCEAGEWKEASVTFFTGDNTDVKLCIYYRSPEVDRKFLYLDNLSLIKDEFSDTPDYIDDTFDLGHNKNWRISDTARLGTSIKDGRLMATPKTTYGSIQSRPLLVKSGCYYEIAFDLDLSEVTDIYVPKLENGKFVIDESLISEDNPNGYVWEINGNSATGEKSPNWINFTLSTAEGKYGEEKAANDASSNLVVFDSNTQNNNIEFVITNSDNSYSYVHKKASSVSGFAVSAIGKALRGLKADDIHIIARFTAPKTCKAYLNIRLNGLGTYYVDNIKVTEKININNAEKIVAETQRVTALGTAIRTSGKQGMRHKTSIDKRLLTADNDFGLRILEYGTLAIKTEYLNGEELVSDGNYFYNGENYSPKKGVAYSFENKTDLVYSKDNEFIEFTGVLVNINEENWNDDYTARAYFKYIKSNGEEGVFYANPFDIAVYPIAKEGYSAKNLDGSFAESEETRQYLYNNIINKFTDKIISVSDTSTPKYTNFQGIRSTVYHCVTFFPDSHGRTYTDAQAAVEMDRLVDSKVDNVRTRFSSQWMWTESGWDWDSEKMTAFYKWADMLQKRDISITLQAGWHLYDFIRYYNYNFEGNSKDYASPHTSIPEVDYLHGAGNDIYGEDTNANEIASALKYGLNDNEKAHYSVAAARYSEWIKQSLNAFKAHGIYNVEYILPFTESGNVSEGDETYSYDEWVIMTAALHNNLKKSGIRNNYKIIGPAQALYEYENRLSLLEYTYDMINGTDYADMLDINALHQYTRPNTKKGYANTVYEPFGSYSLAEENFTYYNTLLENSGQRNTEFWCDEYFAHAPDAKWWDNVGMQMTQFAAGLTAGINNGVNRFLTWQMFDTLWESDDLNGSATSDSEKVGGVHTVGTCPSLIKVDGKTCPNGASCGCNRYIYSSYTPRVTYYGINLIGKYMNNENAKVFDTYVVNDAARQDGGVYVSAIENDEGQTVILVVNAMPTVSGVDIKVEKQNITNFARYTYNPDEIVPTDEAKSIPSDKKITLDGATSFRDVIPAGSFVIYVASKAKYGADIDLPFDFE
ncbi:MAG: hypothetical protein E7551_06220 [Ruminococcaceae bacterium]|nr:hypothetical protein [Oscillospiraceae bacterium]